MKVRKGGKKAHQQLLRNEGALRICAGAFSLNRDYLNLIYDTWLQRLPGFSSSRLVFHSLKNGRPFGKRMRNLVDFNFNLNLKLPSWTNLVELDLVGFGDFWIPRIGCNIYRWFKIWKWQTDIDRMMAMILQWPMSPIHLQPSININTTTLAMQSYQLRNF